MGANGGVGGHASRLAGPAPQIIAVIVAVAAAALAAMGRSAICPCGYVGVWHGTVRSDQNSQRLSRRGDLA